MSCVDVKTGRDAREFFTFPPSGYDLVVHAAAVVGGRETIDNNPLAQAVNLELDAGLFTWARRARPGRIVYLSSSSVYPVALQGSETKCRLHEQDVNWASTQGPDALYGWTKLTGEYLARLALADGQAVTIVRPFSGYGPDQDDTYPFPAFIDRALARADPFAIWGSGEQVRDFIHVDDIVTATLMMVEQEISGPLNLASGQPVSMRELAGMVCEQAGYEPRFECVPTAPSGVEWRVADVLKASQVWVPRVRLAQGIREALKYRK